ncbi:hypothetical protein LR393_30490 [Kineosporia mesophila]|nr:hypothetical protein [Kineosporia mesophila]MCD5354415.1 hypothetical protein [Kineosporia mesophila]
MDDVKPGSTGLDVSRLCRGYGVPERGTHPWTLGEEESRPFVKAGITFFVPPRRPWPDRARRDEIVLAAKVFYPMSDRSTAVGSRARRSWPGSTTACGGWAPTASTLTRSTVSGLRWHRRGWPGSRRSGRATTWRSWRRPARPTPSLFTRGSRKPARSLPGLLLAYLE